MNALYKQYYSKLLAFINSKVHNNADAEDILSEVFIKIYKNIEKLDSDEKLTSWIYTITRNTIIDFYRKNNKTPAFREFKEEFILDESKGERNIHSELSNCLLPMINSLPQNYKEVLYLSEIKGLKQSEIAEEKNLSLTNTKSLIFRGKKKIKEKLFECCSYEYDSLGNVIEYNPKGENCKFC
ncbi:MAG: RNA polymerase sigma factor SigZ [Campylobacteraceae bacterium]|nr:RNA polymerase sigma factor SigZ [Campylobacteraceae bacterium]